MQLATMMALLGYGGAIVPPVVPAPPYGRTNTSPMSVAYVETRPLQGFSTSSVAVPSGSSGAFDLTLAVNPAAYPGTLVPGSYICVSQQSSYDGYLAAGVFNNTTSSPIYYVFGLVKSFDPVAHQLVLTCEGSTSGAPTNMTKSVGAWGNVFTASTNARGRTIGDWQLNMHLPRYVGSNAVYYQYQNEQVIIDAVGRDVDCSNWDWTQAKVAFQNISGTNLGIIDMTQSVFNTANVGEHCDLGVYFFFDSNQRFKLTNTLADWDWRSMATYATVTAGANPGDMVLKVNAEIGGGVPHQSAAYLSRIDALSPPLINNGWHVINLSNPTSMMPCRIKDTNAGASTVILPQYRRFDSRSEDQCPSYLTAGAASTVSGGSQDKVYISGGAVVADSQLYFWSKRGTINDNAETFIGNVVSLGNDGNPFALIDRALAGPIPIGTRINAYSPVQGAGTGVATTAASSGNKLYMPTTQTVRGGQGGTTTIPIVYQGSMIASSASFFAGTPTKLGVVQSIGSDGVGQFVILDKTLPGTVPANTGVVFLSPSVCSAIAPGDRLAFFPVGAGRSGGYGNLNALLQGLCINADGADLYAQNDFMNAISPDPDPNNPGKFLSSPLSFANMRVNQIGVSDFLHSDFFQHYAMGQGIAVTFRNVYLCWGFAFRDKALAGNFGYGNPRDITIGQKLGPFMSDVVFDGFILDNTPATAIGHLIYDTDTGPYRILGTAPNSNGGTRVTFGNYAGLNKGGDFFAGDIYTIGGSGNSALNGPKPLVAGAFASNYRAPQVAVSTSGTTSSGNKMYMTTAVMSACGISKGCLIYNSNSKDYSDTNVICYGAVTDITGSDAGGTYITLDRALPNSLVGDGSLSVLIPQWYDLPVAYVAEISVKVTPNVVSLASNSDTVYVSDTTGIYKGMIGSLKSNYFSFDSGTSVLSVGSDANGPFVKMSTTYKGAAITAATTPVVPVQFSIWMMPCATALKRFSNFKIGYRLAESATEDQLILPGPLQAGMSVENMLDLTTNTPLDFRIVPYGSVPNNIVAHYGTSSNKWYNPQLAAPGVTVTHLATGTIRIDFTSVTGALMYDISLDGGVSWMANRISGAGYATGTSITLNGLVGSGTAMVRPMNAVNDLGFPVNPGLASLGVPWAA